MTDSNHDAYGRIAKYYDRLLEPVNVPLRAHGLQLHPVDDSRVLLDVGCGTGAHLEAYVETGAVCHGIDASPAMLNQARDRLGDRAELRLGDATALPYDSASFDLVFTSLFLHELDSETRTAVLTEMARVVRPDGRILAIDYRVGPLKLKGRMARGVSTVAERVAGRDHYRNWRAYLRAGGVPAMIPDIGLVIDQESIVSGGNLALWLLKPEG